MTKRSKRLVYLDWMRGLAVLVMLQGHVMDGWVRPEDRSSEWFWLSQFLGGLPAPIFLFLVGVSPIVLDRMRSHGASPAELAGRVIRRGIWILALAYAFRVEQFLMWYPASPLSDLLRIDTLNCISICTLLIGLYSVAFKTRFTNIAVMSITTAVFVFITPWVYPLRPPVSSLVLSYLNGSGHAWYFSFFPWAAFALAGITFGYALLEANDRIGDAKFFRGVAVSGVAAYGAGTAMSFSPVFEYGFFDYSLTSPHFFLIRLGLVLLILYGAYQWSTRRGVPGWSPLVVLGQASLLIYWVHIEVVYGRPFHEFAQALELSDAVTHLFWVVPLMVGLAAALRIHRTWSKSAIETAEA